MIVSGLEESQPFGSFRIGDPCYANASKFLLGFIVTFELSDPAEVADTKN